MFERQVCTALDATDKTSIQVALQDRLLPLQYGLPCFLRQLLPSCAKVQVVMTRFNAGWCSNGVYARDSHLKQFGCNV